MDFETVVRERYSCKRYDATRQVSEEQLQAILEAGRLAPTAKNLQEQHIYVVQSPEALGKVDHCTPCRYDAPTVLVVTFDKTNVYTYPVPDGSDGPRRTSGIEDAAIVATHLMLAATNAGVDNCWLNCVHIDELHKALGLPDNEEILMLLDLGYAAAEGGQPKANHFSRKPLSETVSRL